MALDGLLVVARPDGEELIELDGVQPVTLSMSRAAGGTLYDRPSDGEMDMHRRLGTSFQLISIVVSACVSAVGEAGVVGQPYAVMLMPASKRGEVHKCGIDLVVSLTHGNAESIRAGYLGFDPFAGDWTMYGPLGVLAGMGGGRAFVDELGVVAGHYWLAEAHDEAEVLESPAGFPDPETEAKYQRHRRRLLARPFQRVEARRVWGAGSPIELFLLQALARRGLRPQLQMLIMEDGSTFASLYDLWQSGGLRDGRGPVTEADLYFPEQKVAVFCNSTRHHRGGRARAKDAAISERLLAPGSRRSASPVRPSYATWQRRQTSYAKRCGSSSRAPWPESRARRRDLNPRPTVHKLAVSAVQPLSKTGCSVRLSYAAIQWKPPCYFTTVSFGGDKRRTGTSPGVTGAPLSLSRS